MYLMYLLGGSKGLSRSVTQTEWTEPPLESMGSGNDGWSQNALVSW